MIESSLSSVDFIAVNTDVQDLNKSKAEIRLPIGTKLTNGLGAVGVPEVGEKAALEDKEVIQNTLKNSDMVFITAGMGGGTGTGAAPVFCFYCQRDGNPDCCCSYTPLYTGRGKENESCRGWNFQAARYG